MKMLGIVLVILFAHTINGQMSLSCNLTIQADFPDCIQAFLGAENVTEGETIDLLCANSQCQTTIASFVNSCNTMDQEILSGLQPVVTFGCIPVADDTVCFDKVAGFQDGYGDVFLTLVNVTSSCFQEYITGTCSQYCLQTIRMLTDQLGCCYNEAIRLTTSLAPDQTQSDFLLNVFTSDYFIICNSISSQTFCQNGTTIAPSRCPVAIQGLFGGNDTCSNIARQLITSGGNISDDDMPNIACLSRLLEFGDSCNINFLTDCEIATIELFGQNDNCVNAFSVLPNNTVDRISFDMANVALNTVCGTIGCRSRISNFTNRCLPPTASRQYDLFVLELGCRANGAGSCYAVQQSGALDGLTAAFSGGVCATVAFGTQCSDECSAIIGNAVRENGCCVLEVALVGAQQFGINIDIDVILRSCGITSPSRCPQQIEGNFRTIGNNNSATVTMSYVMLISLLALLPILTI